MVAPVTTAPTSTSTVSVTTTTATTAISAATATTATTAIATSSIAFTAISFEASTSSKNCLRHLLQIQLATDFCCRSSGDSFFEIYSTGPSGRIFSYLVLLSSSCLAITTTFGANIELSRCTATLTRPSCPKLDKSEVTLPIPVHQCFRPSAISRVSREVKCRISRKGSVTYSMSSSNEDGSLTYKNAGVDIDAGSELVRRIAKMAPGIGGFGGLYPHGDSYLVAGTDGVGTKLKLAFETGIHETIGIDLVAMSVNDIVTSGAKPLFFLDYYATSRLDVDLAEKTAEMPDFYADGEYDLSGFAVGSVKKDIVINGKNIMVGDILIGLPSSGVHSNGFSLVRRVLARSGLSLKDQIPGESVTLSEALMAPTVIYVKQVIDIISKGGVKGIAHITGGGFTDNIPRVFPEGLGAVIYKGSWMVPPIFKWIQEAGRVEDAEMRRTFNMGIGMVLVVSLEAALRILGEAHGANTAYRIGEVVKGDGVSYQ